MDYKHASHSIYDLKVHTVFCTKYRYRILTGEVGTRTRELILEICRANYSKCKQCGSDARVKNVYVQGKQRYKCKDCGKNYREGDLREKYSTETRLRVIKWYLEGAGIMSIERMEGLPNPLIIKWIRKICANSSPAS